MPPTKLNFEMTPERKETPQRELREPSRVPLHPFLKSNVPQIDGWDVTYNPEIKLPELGDKKAILAWLGVKESVSDMVIHEYKQHALGLAPEPFGLVLRQSYREFSKNKRLSVTKIVEEESLIWRGEGSEGSWGKW